MMMWVGTAALFVLTGVVAGRVVEAEWRVTSPALAPGKGGVQPHNIDATPPLQVYPLHLSGDSTNRVNLVFFSDGYTHHEREKFLLDAQRLSKDLTANQTFAPVLPLLNFYAAFTPSIESGIGIGGKQKDTVFGLYRDGTELRGVYPGKPDVARATCEALAPRCDYPILLGNDPYYGGLGGDVSITTSSILNGPLVLRHELGHSIIDVGEEYDGGTEYFGANSSPNITMKGFKWAHWLAKDHLHHHYTDSDLQLSDTSKSSLLSSSPLKTPRVERATMPHQSYPWTLLNHTSPYTIRFHSSGTYHSYVLRTSLSGLPQATHLKVSLDGIDLGWTPREEVGLDRWFYDLVSKDRIGVAW